MIVADFRYNIQSYTKLPTPHVVPHEFNLFYCRQSKKTLLVWNLALKIVNPLGGIINVTFVNIYKNIIN